MNRNTEDFSAFWHVNISHGANVSFAGIFNHLAEAARFPAEHPDCTADAKPSIFPGDITSKDPATIYNNYSTVAIRLSLRNRVGADIGNAVNFDTFNGAFHDEKK